MIKKAVITGAGGFIGGALTQALLAQGAEVWAVTRRPESVSPATSDKLHVIVAAFEDYAGLSEQIGQQEIDVFFHLAWEVYGTATNDAHVQARNIYYSCDAARAAAEIGCKRFVFADSSHEHLMSRNPAGQFARCSVYGTAKIGAREMCAAICHNAGMEFVGVLFIRVFGVGDKSLRSSNSILRKMLRGEDVSLIDGNRLYSWTYIDDCVRGVIAAAEKGKAGKVYCVSAPLKPFSEIVDEAHAALKSNAALHYGAYVDRTEIDFSKIDMEALTCDTGFCCKCDFAESVRKTAQWLEILDGE